MQNEINRQAQKIVDQERSRMREHVKVLLKNEEQEAIHRYNLRKQLEAKRKLERDIRRDPRLQEAWNEMEEGGNQLAMKEDDIILSYLRRKLSRPRP